MARELMLPRTNKHTTKIIKVHEKIAVNSRNQTTNMIGLNGQTIKNEDEDDPYGISSNKYSKQKEPTRDEYANEAEEEEVEGDFIQLHDDEPMDEEEPEQYTPNRGRNPQKENSTNSYNRRQTIGGQSTDNDRDFRKSRIR